MMDRKAMFVSVLITTGGCTFEPPVPYTEIPCPKATRDVDGQCRPLCILDSQCLFTESCIDGVCRRRESVDVTDAGVETIDVGTEAHDGHVEEDATVMVDAQSDDGGVQEDAAVSHDIDSGNVLDVGVDTGVEELDSGIEDAAVNAEDAMPAAPDAEVLDANAPDAVVQADAEVPDAIIRDAAAPDVFVPDAEVLDVGTVVDAGSPLDSGTPPDSGVPPITCTLPSDVIVRTIVNPTFVHGSGVPDAELLRLEVQSGVEAEITQIRVTGICTNFSSNGWLGFVSATGARNLRDLRVVNDLGQTVCGPIDPAGTDGSNEDHAQVLVLPCSYTPPICGMETLRVLGDTTTNTPTNIGVTNSFSFAVNSVNANDGSGMSRSVTLQGGTQLVDIVVQ